MAVGFGCKSVRTNFDTSMRGGVAVILAVSCRQQQEERAITPARVRERERLVEGGSRVRGHVRQERVSHARSICVCVQH